MPCLQHQREVATTIPIPSVLFSVADVDPPQKKVFNIFVPSLIQSSSSSRVSVGNSHEPLDVISIIDDTLALLSLGESDEIDAKIFQQTKCNCGQDVAIMPMNLKNACHTKTSSTGV
jgi:hypothetical protein